MQTPGGFNGVANRRMSKIEKYEKVEEELRISTVESPGESNNTTLRVPTAVKPQRRKRNISTYLRGRRRGGMNVNGTIGVVVLFGDILLM